MSKLVTVASNIYRVLLKLTTGRYAHMLTYAHNVLHPHIKEVTNDKITPKGQGDCRNISDYPLDGNSQTTHTYIVLTIVNPDKGNSCRKLQKAVLQPNDIVQQQKKCE